MYDVASDTPDDRPGWVRLIHGYPDSRENTRWFLLLATALVMLAFLMPFVDFIDSLMNGFAKSWTPMDTVILIAGGGLAFLCFVYWLGIRWMDAHGKWPAQVAPATRAS